MPEVSVIIPNYNGMKYLPAMMESLEKQEYRDFETILVDNGSTDESVSWAKARNPKLKVLLMGENTGFAHAVNEGIRHSASPFVLLLNNDTEADPGFIGALISGIRRHNNAFSCASRMIRSQDRSQLDDAGDYYNALGWAYARGKGKAVDTYLKEEKIFAACAGAAIYRRRLLEKTGLFDEEHFAYLEDIDLGYRARILGFENWYIPDALIYHVGSGTSGSRYNQFKTRYSSRNNVYLIYKNMPCWQILLNLPFLTAGFLIKLLFFAIRGMGREYLAGIKNGFQISRPDRKVRVCGHQADYLRIQLELWRNLFR